MNIILSQCNGVAPKHCLFKDVADGPTSNAVYISRVYFLYYFIQIKKCRVKPQPQKPLLTKGYMQFRRLHKLNIIPRNQKDG